MLVILAFGKQEGYELESVLDYIGKFHLQKEGVGRVRKEKNIVS